jgi:hypothetical protein
VVDIYRSATNQDGRLGAVFEQDDQTAFFYLIDLIVSGGMRITEAFDVATLVTTDADVDVKWNAHGNVAGLFCEGGLIAVFDVRAGAPYGRRAEADDESVFG